VTVTRTDKTVVLENAGQRYCVLKFCKKRLRAFTLLECLVALLSISLSMLVIQGMTVLVTQEFKAIRQSDDKNWQNFSNLLRRELENAELDKVTKYFLYVQTPNGSRRFGMKTGSDDFRKTNEQGQGYQPMIYGVSSAEFSNDGNVVTIHITFSKGGERRFIYAFSNVK
jgi:competence protein ComGF